jgi:superkiller protein 3
MILENFMRKELKFYRCGLLLVFLALAPGYVFGQDLGSSTGLFNSSKSKAKTTPKTEPKKTTPKPKSTTAAVKKTPPKPAPKPRNTTAAAQNTTKSTSSKTAASKTDVPKSDLTKSTSKNNSTKKPSAKTQTASKQTAKTPVQNNTVIKVGQPTPKVEPLKSNSINTENDELFERSIEEGNLARDEREYAKAEAAYLRAQSLKTKDSRAIYGLGNLYSDQQRWEEAEAAYRMAIGFEPNKPDAYVALSYVLTQPIVGMDLGGRYAEAEKLARQAIALDPDNAVAYDQLGVALELSGEVGDETRNAYRKAIQLDPNFALAYAHLGRLLRRNGLNNESSAAYRTAIQMSLDVPTMIMVADVMQSQQRYLESEELLRRALRQDPKNPTALFLLGRALTTRSSFEEAEKVLKKSAEISPKSFISYALLGSLYTRREKYDDAEKYLMKAVKMISLNEKKRLAQDFEAVGDGFMRAGKNKDAARVYRQAMALDREKNSLSEKLANSQLN